jgi:hypothetical protein
MELKMKTRKQSSIFYLENFKILLADYLGVYELSVNGVVKGETPSIRINYPRVTEAIAYKMKENKGIECIIKSEPNTNIQFLNFGNTKNTRYWEILLIQHDPTDGLTDVIDYFYTFPSYMRPVSQPAIRDAIQLPNKQGIEPPRTIIYIPQTQFNDQHFL